VADKLQLIHSSGYTAADTQWQIQSGRYTGVDTSIRYTTVDSSFGYTAVDILQQIQQ
jgi:hypothetical protein